MPLTTKQIENAKPKDKPYKLADAGGLCLLVAPSGARLWRWRYRFAGKEKMMAFGEFTMRPLAESGLQFSTELAVCSDNKNRIVKEFVKVAGRKLDILRRPVQQSLNLTA